MAIPEGLMRVLRPVTVIVGHYGTGKTNFTVNLAVDLASAGATVTVIDLDVVNPYFRATEQRALLERRGVGLVAPVFSEAGTSLDVPSLTGRVSPTLRDAKAGAYVIVDAGGDDVGATALGRFSRDVSTGDYAMLYVANRFRNLVQEAHDALENLCEIEVASHLSVTALVNNSHLKEATTSDTIARGVAYVGELSSLSGLPVVCTTVPEGVEFESSDLYPVRSYVKSPWE